MWSSAKVDSTYTLGDSHVLSASRGKSSFRCNATVVLCTVIYRHILVLQKNRLVILIVLRELLRERYLAQSCAPRARAQAQPPVPINPLRCDPKNGRVSTKSPPKPDAQPTPVELRLGPPPCCRKHHVCQRVVSYIPHN